MVVLGVVLYLMLAVAAVAVLCLPGLRDLLRAAGWRGLVGVRRRADGLAGGIARLQRGVASVRRAGIGARAAAPGLLPVPGSSALAAALVVLAVPSLAVLLRQWHAYDGFDHTRSRPVDTRVATLLQGEQLVPPPALPPALFITREIERARPLVATASRQWELLEPEFRQRLLQVFQRMRERHGYEMVLIEGYRSPERQMQLAGLGPHTTHARAGQSYHQFGLAADCAFLRDGRILISERDPWAAEGYALFGALARAGGLQWGGAWRTLRDLGHVEMPRPELLQRATPA